MLWTFQSGVFSTKGPEFRSCPKQKYICGPRKGICASEGRRTFPQGGLDLSLLDNPLRERLCPGFKAGRKLGGLGQVTPLPGM